MNKYNKAFTFVELMVTISIIVILSGIVMSNVGSARSKSRDAKRISDLGQIQMAIQLFMERCTYLPLPNSSGELDTSISNGCPTGTTLGTYLTQIPVDPKTGNKYTYRAYQAYGGSSPHYITDYHLVATLENNNNVLKDDADYNADCTNATPSALGTNWVGAPCDSNNVRTDGTGSSEFMYDIRPY